MAYRIYPSRDTVSQRLVQACTQAGHVNPPCAQHQAAIEAEVKYHQDRLDKQVLENLKAGYDADTEGLRHWILQTPDGNARCRCGRWTGPASMEAFRQHEADAWDAGY